MGEHLLCTQGVASSNLVASTTREKGSHRNVLFALLLFGCVSKRPQTGLVMEDGGRLYLSTAPGESTPLEVTTDSQGLERLLGFKVKVEGQPKWGRMAVDSYQVLDAGYGVPPHVGVLEARSGRLMMHDRNTGALLELVGETADGLWDLIGSLVLVNGVVDGPHQVRVMNYIVLVENNSSEKD